MNTTVSIQKTRDFDVKYAPEANKQTNKQTNNRTQNEIKQINC